MIHFFGVYSVCKINSHGTGIIPGGVGRNTRNTEGRHLGNATNLVRKGHGLI